MALRIGFLVSHPIQYYAPIFRELAKRCELTVFFAHRQTAAQQARAGFGVAFEWDVDLLSGYNSRFLTNVARNPSTDEFWGCDTPDIAREIAEGRFDAFVVPGWALKSYLQAVRACRRAGVPVFVRGDSQLTTPRNALLRFAKELIFPWLLRRFSGFFYVGKWNREYLEHYGAKAEQLFFSPHCVDNEAFRRGSEAARKRAAGVPKARKRILFVGKLVENKHPLDIVQAAVQIAARGTPVEVAFAGSGELADSLKEFAKNAGLEAHFLGFVNQSEMPAVYASADVVVLASASETWGLAINEAMVCGVPAVVSDVVGCGPDLIDPKATGAIFRQGDVSAMARAIESVFALDPQTCRDRLAALMEVYSPERAAESIVAGANSFYRPGLLK